MKKKKYQLNPLITNFKKTERKTREPRTLALDFSSPLVVKPS